MASYINSRRAAIGKTCLRDLPRYSTVYWFYLQWRTFMSTRRTDESLTLKECVSRLKKAKLTTLMIIGSQAVQNTLDASIASKGYCFYKSTDGIKSHKAVDTLGFTFFTHC
jgi:hypothetical protein